MNRTRSGAGKTRQRPRIGAPDPALTPNAGLAVITEVLDRYMAAFERSDVEAIEQLLADDATLEMTGTTTWFSGKGTCVPYIADQAIGRPGEWRMLPLQANGQLAAAAYRRDDRTYLPFAIVVLATTRTHLTRITLFSSPALFGHFRLPATLPAPS